MLTNDIKDELLMRFNRDNALQPYVTQADVIWTDVEIWLQGECNSRATITANANSFNFKGSHTLYFNRRSIEKDLKGLKIPGKRSNYTGLHGIINVLHDKCGVPLKVEEFLNLSLPATGPITIQPTTICMAYMPTTSVQLEFAET